MAYFLYILLCADNTLYTGTTNDVEKRVSVHSLGKGSKYVRSRLPVKLIYTEEFTDNKVALSREWEIKQWTREQKIERLNLELFT
jgi:putative endonuclease